jgi:hypothetical protein
MGVKKDIYLKVKELIEELVEIKHFAVWNSQVFNESMETVYNFPAAFFAFEELGWNKLSALAYNTNLSQQQGGSISFTIYIAFSELKYETQVFPDQLDLVDKVWSKLSGVSGENFSTIYRLGELQDVDHDRVSIWQITFMIDTATESGETGDMIDASPVTLDLTANIDIDNDIIRTGDGTL